MQLIARLVLLLSLTSTLIDVIVGKSNSSASQSQMKPRPYRPPDDIMKAKCGFTLNEIHECKIKKCGMASSQCDGDERGLLVCMTDKCHDARIECEKPLNQHLSPEEICEGDGFTNVDRECQQSNSSSLELLNACKAKNYVKVRRACFAPVWKKRIHDVGTKTFSTQYMTNEFVDCAYLQCFEKVEECIKKHHHEFAKNTRSQVEFSLDHCAYVTNVYPHDCEKPNCTETMTACFASHPTPASMIPIFAGAAVAGLLVVSLIIFLILKFVRRGTDEGFTPVAKC